MTRAICSFWQVMLTPIPESPAKKDAWAFMVRQPGQADCGQEEGKAHLRQERSALQSALCALCCPEVGKIWLARGLVRAVRWQERSSTEEAGSVPGISG